MTGRTEGIEVANASQTVTVDCPCCGQSRADPWMTENGYDAVRCSTCRLIYVNPRPIGELIDESVRTGVHGDGKNAISRRVPSKVRLYEGLLGDMFADVWSTGRRISWIDIGSGYGEVLEAVIKLASLESLVMGVEPMLPKAQDAQNRGLRVENMFLSDVSERFEFASLIDVFSHVPDFGDLLSEIAQVLCVGGELLIETGDIGGLRKPGHGLGGWDLPDHLVFAGESNMRSFLDQSGFDVVSITKRRVDGFEFSAKNMIKRALGRPAPIRLPYTSPYRTMFIRARLRDQP